MLSVLRDSSFTKPLLELAVPIALQQLVFSTLNLAIGLMVGQLGETPVAAVGLANQILFLFQLLLFGLASGSSIYFAQFWGQQDIKNIHRVLGITLGLGLIASMVFSFIAIVIPDRALAVYTSDPGVIALGSDYLRISGVSYVATALTTLFSVALRCTGDVRLPFAISTFATGLGAVLDYLLIFGVWGLPVLGVHGAALGTTIARLAECLLLLLAAYSLNSAAAFRLRDLFAFDRGFLQNVLKTIVPVMVNEILWSVGISAYSLVYARMSTEAIAAVSIVSTFENMAFVPFSGLANGAAILIGNRIGSGSDHLAMTYAKRLMMLVILLGAIVGAIVFLGADWALSYYQVGDSTRDLARAILTILSLVLWIKASNMMLIVGILRAGGDTRASFMIDVGPLWFVGLPAALAGAFVFHLPAQWVYLLAMTDEMCKCLVASIRMLSKRWIHNLARRHSSLDLQTD